MEQKHKFTRPTPVFDVDQARSRIFDLLRAGRPASSEAENVFTKCETNMPAHRIAEFQRKAILSFADPALA